MFLVLKMVYKYTAALEVLFSVTCDHDIKEDVKTVSMRPYYKLFFYQDELTPWMDRYGNISL